MRVAPLLFVLACGGSPDARPPLSSDSTAVLAALAVQRDVDGTIARRGLSQRDSSAICPQSGLEARATLYSDGRGRVRRLETQAGSDDHGEAISAYFDTLGHATLMIARRGAVNGAQMEERMYFDASGREVRRTERRDAGPSYTFRRITRAPSPATWVRDACG